jgi:hypothetical protein
MISEISVKQEVFDACKEYKVKELHVFGSAVFQELRLVNDLDFLVLFERDGTEGAFKQFMGFKDSLESIFGKEVDLLTVKKFRNRIFEEEVNRTKQLVYAA